MLLDQQFLGRLRKLTIADPERRLRGGRGGRRGKSAGASAEFSHHRVYRPGDDYRRLDWNLYARLEKLFVKIFHEEVNRTVEILIDTSASMGFGRPSKLAASVRIAAAVGYVALLGLDRVRAGLLTPERIRGVGPLRGTRQAARLFSFLSEAEASGRVDLLERLMELRPAPGSLLLLLSDFMAEGPFHPIVSRICFPGTQVVLMQVLAPAEIEPNLDGELELVDSESGEIVEVSGGGTLESAYRKRLRGLEQDLSRPPATFLRVACTGSLEAAVFVSLRRARVLR